MDFLEHLNPLVLEAYLNKMALALTEDGYLYVNSPMFGEDDVFGTVFPPYLREWRDVGNTSFWRRLDCDPLGWPKHGHLVWASPVWWEEKFRASGLVRDREVEAIIHGRLKNFFETSPARKCLFVLKKSSNRRRADQVGEAIIHAIDSIGEVV